MIDIPALFDVSRTFKMKRSILLGASVSFHIIYVASAAEPAWWTFRSDKVVVPTASPDAFSYANVGQAKWMAKCAIDSLQEVSPSLANDVEGELVGPDLPVASWAVPVSGTNEAEAHYSPVIIGQVKAIVTPFYDKIHLIAPSWLQGQMAGAGTLNSGTYYPWSVSTADDDNRAVANQGQLKAAFSIDFFDDDELVAHSDGIPDLWEYALIAKDGGLNWTDISQINYSNAQEATASVGFDPIEESVAMHAYGQVATRIEGKTASAAQALYSTQLHAPTIADPHGVYVRNPNFWGDDLRLKLTCISPANSNGVNPWYQRGNTAITPQHVITSDHENYHAQVGEEIRFVTADNIVVARTVVATRRVVNSPDYHLVLLNDPLPNSIVPCKIPPADFESYLPQGMASFGFHRPGILGLSLDQEEKGVVGAWVRAVASNVAYVSPLDPTAATFFEGVAVGDSGNPTFMIINGELVLLTVLTGGDYSGGAGFASWHEIEEINETIELIDAGAAISTGFSVSVADLSGFPKVRYDSP